ncbi:hypothetical protein [Oricola thermophila]|uniref:Uncharacterized protein n=1 Tax=Oricola thermophila TaxID=2742145 RepID=A0A6N1VC79_9HYPH|nr:hypothetical protein [Oricola thermophila]QKV18641.1 hypothetical protein HTY61_09370 [Oricola thermophila]
MTDRPANRTGRKPILKPDPPILKLIYEFALNGYSGAEAARRLDVHPDTLKRFMLREPKARRARDRGRAERRRLLLAGPAARRDLPGPERPKPGQTCPTCGSRVGLDDQAIVLTPAFMADARRRFENIIDKYIAAKRDAEAGGADEAATGGAEGGR